jgi:hypothetical protein
VAKKGQIWKKNHESRHSGWRDLVQKHADCTGATKKGQIQEKMAESFVN